MEFMQKDTSKLLEDASRSDYGSVVKISGKKHKAEKQMKSKFSLFFKFATCADLMLMFIGGFFAVLSGILLPILGLFFGKMTNAFINQAINGLIPDELVNSNYTSTTSMPSSIEINETFVASGNQYMTMIPLTTSQFHSILNEYFIVYIIIGTVMLISAFLQSLCWELASEHVVYNVRRLYLLKILGQDISWYDQNDNGNLPNKLADDAERVREGTGYKCGHIIQYTSTFLGGVVVGFVVNVQLTLVILCVTPFLIALTAYSFKFGANSMVREQQKYAAAGEVAEEALSNIKTVNAFGGQLVEVQRYNYWLEEGRKEAMKKYNTFAVTIGLNFFIMYGAYALGFAVGSYLIQMGISNAGSVFTVFFSVVVGSISIGQSLPYWNAVAGTIGVLSSINEIIERKVTIDTYAKTGRKTSRFVGRIDFRNTSFAYPTRPEIKVLDGLNMVIEPGKQMAIVGSSGSGKSTIINLILRFYDATNGEIYIDDIPVKDYNIEWLRKQIGLVSQEPVLFGVSIAENISYGSNDVSQKEIIEAAKQANAHNFIVNLPRGYDTLVGDTGSQLSGGQKQRIAIARALVRDPKILLLDEATSALDSMSEGIVQDTLEKVMKGRTTIIVAHRLSTIRNADTICVMQKGQLIEYGTHSELMAKRSLYYELVQAQILSEKPSQEDDTLKEGDNFSPINGWRTGDEAVHRSDERPQSIDEGIDEDGVTENKETEESKTKDSISRRSSNVKRYLDDTNWKSISEDGVEIERPWKILDQQVSTKTISDDDDEEYETVIVRVRETREVLYSTDEEKESADDKETVSFLTNELLADTNITSTPINEKNHLGKFDFSHELTDLEIRNKPPPAPEVRKLGFIGDKNYFNKIERGMSLYDLLKLQQPEWPWLLMGTIGFICCGLITPLFAIYYGAIFKVFTMIGEEFVKASKFWTYMFVGFAAFCGITYLVQVKGMTHANEKLIARTRALTFENILRQPVGWFDLELSSPGVLVNRLARNAPLIKAAAGLRAGQVLASGVTLVAATIIAFACGWKLALVLVILVPFIIGLSIKQQNILNRNVNRDVNLMDKAGQIASEAVRNIRTVQALGQERLFTEMYSRNLEAPYKEGKVQAFYYALLFGLTQGIAYYMYAIAFRVGGYLIEIGDMNSENLYRIFFALSLCANSVGMAFSFMQDYSKARHSVRLLNYLLKRPSEIDSSSKSGAKPEIVGRVEFKDVYFSYPTRPSVKVLRGLNLLVEAGKTLALVGESGCGKSTVISLLERFYELDSGTVLIDGFDIRSLNLAYVRSKIGIVTQEPILFDTSIKDNIAYGLIALQERVPFHRIKNAAQTANIHDFIMALPDRYDTMVGERGVQLSGGQKQRIALARALIRNPKILLLDEATSALDTESEKIVQAALDKAKIGRTCIIVAHRLSTIQNADVICVVQKGEIVEAGTHDELVKLKGQYYKLTKRQSLL